MKNKVVISWINKHSREMGYVAGVSLKEGHIISTDDKKYAKTYTESSAKGIISTLAKRNIDQQNIYEAVPADCY